MIVQPYADGEPQQTFCENLKVLDDLFAAKGA